MEPDSKVEPAPATQPSTAAWAGDFRHGRAHLIHADCFEWLRDPREDSMHAVVTDTPYGLVEYDAAQQQKLRDGKGGIWRIPPSFDGARRSPVPRFTVLGAEDREDLAQFFHEFGCALLPV